MTAADSSKEHFEIPIIDLSRDEAVVAKELLNAFTKIGFCIVVNHGVDSSTLTNSFASSKAFFDLPLATKQQYKYQGHTSNRGFIAMGDETHTTPQQPDKKETFEIGRNDEPEYPNHWPVELANEDFKKDFTDYFTTFNELYLRLMKYIAVGFDLDPDFFNAKCNGQHCNLRLLHYPEVKKDANMVPVDSNEPIVRGARHTDYGTLTLLSQDAIGGLRVQPHGGDWTYVPPVPGGIVINVGDMLQQWTNDVLQATPHQVVEPPGQSKLIPERYSIAFFCNANKECVLDKIEGVSDEPFKYPPMTAHDYITKRLSETIAG
jgi:isopenicillin N synthase-like dioxygenase